MPTTLRFAALHGICLVVHGEHDPKNADWAEYLRFMSERAMTLQGVLAWVPGKVGPNAVQRRAVADMWRAYGRNPPVAVVGATAVQRSIVTALSFFLPNEIRAFSQDRWFEAYPFLGVEEYAAQFDQKIAVFRTELSATILQRVQG